MKKKILKSAITVSGKDFWGRDSSVTFVPTTKDGWYLRTKYHGDVPIDYRIAYSKWGRIQLCTGGTTVNFIEHVLALKILLGLDRIILVPHTTWLPYLGGAGEYARRLEGGLIQTDEEFKMIEPIKNASISAHNEIGSRVRINLTSQQGLRVKLYSQWVPLPEYVDTVSLEDLNDADFRQKILNAKPQGFPFYRERIATLLEMVIGWPNMKYVAWVTNFNTPEEASFQWWAHALQDTYGCLVLCHHQYLPSLYYIRKYAGHKLDLKIIKRSYSSLKD